MDVHSQTHPPGIPGDAATGKADLLAAFVGPNHQAHYQAVFDRFEREGGWISWHWPACFVTWGWLAYRKMWAWFFIYWLVFPFIVTVLAVFLGALNGLLGALVYIAGMFLVPPLFANRLYYQHATSKLRRVRFAHRDPQSQAAEAARLGGTSVAAAVIVGVVSGLVVPAAILAAIAIPAYQDYTVRAQVAESLVEATPVKLSVSEYYYTHQRMPGGIEDLAPDGAPVEGSAMIRSIEVQQGEIVLTLGGQADGGLHGARVLFTPILDGQMLRWSCRSPDIPQNRLPSACRER